MKCATPFANLAAVAAVLWLSVAHQVVQAQLSPPHLRDIGILGLLSHDIFAWDSKNETNTENGRVDLSTIFDYDGGSRLDEGGNPKNEENAPVFTVTMQLVESYKKLLQSGKSGDEARRETVAGFHEQIRVSFVRLTDLPFPDRGLNANVTNVEQAVFRSMHDILPGRARYRGRGFFRNCILRSFKVTNIFLAKMRLTELELSQELKDFDGRYDIEYEQISIPFAGITINLTESDRKFIEKFSSFKQVDMLRELGRAGRGEIPMRDVTFMNHTTELMRKAICATGNVWMPQDVPCDEV